MVNTQEWLEKEYPHESRKEITKLEIAGKYLESEINLTDFTNLNELVITQKRNWEDFYQWLNDNIVDINEKGDGKGNVKEAKRDEYPALINWSNCIGHLMNGLEVHLGKTLIDYVANNQQISYQEPVLAYDETKTFFQLASGKVDNFKCGFSFILPEHQRILDDYEKLLTEWKNSTHLINLNIKLERGEKINELNSQLIKKEQENQALKKQIYDYRKTNLEALLTKKEQGLTEIKENIIKKNSLNEDNQEELTNLLELQTDLINNDNLSALNKQLLINKKRLSKIITNEEITLLCRLQTELTELKNQEQELTTRVEIN